MLQKYKPHQFQPSCEPIIQLEDTSCQKCFRLLLDGFEFHCELTLHNSHQYQHQKLTSEVHQEIPLPDKLNYPHASSFIFVVFSPVHQLEINSFTLKMKSEFILEREKP